MVQANVGQNVTPQNPSLQLILYHFLHMMITSSSATTQTTNKHHKHGDGAACPASGVDSMNLRRPSGGRLVYSFSEAAVEGFS